MTHWTTFFSRSGSEIYEVSKKLGRFPDVIVTNKIDLSSVHPGLLGEIEKRNITFHQICPTPTVEQYMEIIPYRSIVTLHGWMRIVPPKICKKYTIYNGHPGYIHEFPVLKGKDPQKKALQLKLSYTGCVIHEVTPGVDEGECLYGEPCPIRKSDTVARLSKRLHNISVNLWLEFFREEYGNLC